MNDVFRALGDSAGRRKKQMTRTLIAVLLLCGSVCYGQVPTWHQKMKRIVPASSTLQDIEHAFANADLQKRWVSDGVEARYYRMREGRLSLYLASGECTVGAQAVSVPRNTVLQATFFPVEETTISKFKLAKREFLETMENDNPTVNLISSRLGLEYSTQKKRVISLTVFPAGFSSDSFKCLNR